MAKSYAYDAYGNTTITDNNTNIVNSFAYAKAVIDTETGLYYMNARYYDPETGRFISQDTYRGTGEAFWHLYLYCDDDPVNHIDPSGHWLLDAVFLAADVVSFIKKPSLGKALWIVADLLCFLDPSGVASTLAHAGKVAKVAKAAKVLKSKKVVQAAKVIKNSASVTKITNAVKKAIALPKNKRLYRVMSEAELKVVKGTGILRGGKKGKTYFTDSYFKNANNAKSRLSLETKPEYIVEFKITNSPKIQGGKKVIPDHGGTGGGREYWSQDAIKIKIVNYQKMIP